MSKKQSISSQLDAYYQFCARNLEQRPEVFVHAPKVVNNPTFFTVQRLQEHLNNPLLTPEWITVVSKGQRVPLEEEATLTRIVQRKELRFMDKIIINNHLSQGAAVVLEGIEVLDKNINEFARRIDESLPCASTGAVSFFSQHEQEAYGGHRDSDDVLVIQLAGEKQWKIFEPQQRAYLGNSPLTLEQMGPEVAELTMKPGDAIYIRAGAPHIVRTPKEFSLHMAFDIRDRTTNVEQITHEANNRYNYACAEPYSSAASLLDRYVNLLKSEEFQADLKSANENMRQEAMAFRKRMGHTSSVNALSRYK